MNKIILSRPPSYSSKYEGYEYQRDAVEKVKSLEFGAIFHEQGLGKTKIGIDILLSWLHNDIADTVIIVAKKSLITNWKEELKTHCHINPRIINNNRENTFFILNSPTKIILTNYESIKTEKARLRLFLKTRRVGIILDEATKIKNPTSELSKAFLELSPLFCRRIIMTGTPVANRPYDIWAQIFFLDHGESLGKDFIEFKKLTDLNNNLHSSNNAKEAFENAISAIWGKIKHFSVRETKSSGVITLPEKKTEDILCDWGVGQKEYYESIRNDLACEYVINGKVALDDTEMVLKRLVRLVQAASNPRLINPEYAGGSGKLKKLNEIVESITSKKEKVIIWTSFNDNVGLISKSLEPHQTLYIYGRMDMSSRDRSISRFKQDEKCSILIATPGAAKEGLTLTVANNAIFYDRMFSLDDYLQAQDRIHRISQTKACTIFNLLMEESIDIWINQLLESKSIAAMLAQNDISKETYKDVMNYDYGKLIKEILGTNK